MALLSIADIAVFFAVLLVGFAYVWRRGAFGPAVSRERSAPRDDSSASVSLEQQPGLDPAWSGAVAELALFLRHPEY